ncbi:hypothetical protein T439DRAFT_289176 [Meredithblackwellia eburnea MCA 4105]
MGTQLEQKKKSKKWLWIIIAIVLVLVIAGGVLGGIFGSRAAKNNKSGSNNTGGGNSAAGTGTGVATKTAGSANGAVIPTATDANGNPLYPTTTGSAKIAAPTVIASSALSCGSDPYQFSNPASLTVRAEHPLLFAPKYKWDCLPKQIAADSYMASWNATIFANATKFYDMAPTQYVEDGGLSGSGVLDVAREVQLRIKHWGYAYKISNDTKWVDRAWLELQTAAGNSTTGQSFGTAPDNWNTQHFLDVGEFTAAFGLGYDWFYDAWTQDQRTAIMWSIINLGLRYGILAHQGNAAYSWWTKVNGNWNCVCNGGLTIGALAIANEDPTGVAAQLLSLAVPNANANCAMAPSPDGTWSETPNYWYFGTTGHAQMAAALLSATGSTQNLLDGNPGMKLSGLYHMYVTGQQGMFNYGDTGPNKYVATANGMMFYGAQYNIPMYTLFQRDRGDAPEPMSMLYYDPQVSGQFWDGLALDHHFDNTTDGWGSMRSTWTDTQGSYIAMKAGALLGHQAHGDLDAGTFVLDALGQRWAGELGNGNYLADGYFSSELQNSQRWLYYRKRTEGQNTLVMGGQNQNVNAVPTTEFGSSGEQQDGLVYKPANASTAFMTADLSTAYNGTSVKRGIRFLNGRRQVLLQDEVTVPAAGVQWRMQTNATVALSSDKKSATLTLGGETLIARILSPAAATFDTAQAVRLASDPATPTDAASQDQPNPGVTVLTIAFPTGRQSVQVLFNPQWHDFNSNSYVTPPTVALDSWTVTSHE